MTRPSNYFPAPGRGGLRQSFNRPGRGYQNVGDRGAMANGPSQRGDENGDPHSDDDSSQEELSAFSQEEDNDEEDEEEREEDRTPITVTTQNNTTRGRFRGRGGGGQRGRFRGRGYRNTGNSNTRFSNRGGGRGNHRGPQGRNPRQSYPSPNTTRANQSDKKTEDATVQSSQIDNHDEQLEQEVAQPASIPKDQRPPRERRTATQHASGSSPTNEQHDSALVKDQPTD